MHEVRILTYCCPSDQHRDSNINFPREGILEIQIHYREGPNSDTCQPSHIQQGEQGSGANLKVLCLK